MTFDQMNLHTVGKMENGNGVIKMINKSSKTKNNELVNMIGK